MSGSVLEANAWIAWIEAIFLVESESWKKFDVIFCDLNGDTLYPKSENALQRPMTRVLLPAPDEVP
jgi:hypothetical protein